MSRYFLISLEGEDENFIKIRQIEFCIQRTSFSKKRPFLSYFTAVSIDIKNI